MSPTPTNDNVSEALLVEQARIDRDRIECMQTDIKKLQLALLQLSTEQTLLAMRAPTSNLGLWGWVVAICVAALLGAVVGQMPVIVRVLGAAC